MSILRDLWTEEGIDNEMITTYQYVFDLRNRIEETCALARENLLTAQQKYMTKQAVAEMEGTLLDNRKRRSG